MLAVINLGISNLNSVLNALNYININYFVLNKKEEFNIADKFILPGVGTFAAGISALKEKDFFDALYSDVINKKKNILGICLGQQLLFESSVESPGTKGLSLLKGKVLKLPASMDYNIPRIGWAENRFQKDFLGFKKDEAFDSYYIHSYSVVPEDDSVIAATTEINNIVGAISCGNIYGCQFHPEKSHSKGLKIIKQFSEI